MRYVTLVMALSGCAAAQNGDWSQPNLPQYFHQFKLPLKPPAVATPPKITLAPGQQCAIPLLNALKKDATNDPMIRHLRPPKNPAASKGIVPPPAPSCDDVR